MYEKSKSGKSARLVCDACNVVKSTWHPINPKQAAPDMFLAAKLHKKFGWVYERGFFPLLRGSSHRCPSCCFKKNLEEAKQ